MIPVIFAAVCVVVVVVAVTACEVVKMPQPRAVEIKEQQVMKSIDYVPRQTIIELGESEWRAWLDEHGVDDETWPYYFWVFAMQEGGLAHFGSSKNAYIAFLQWSIVRDMKERIESN